MDATRIDKIAGLLQKCWSAITKITQDWPIWAEFQFISKSDWKRFEPVYLASNLSNDARGLYELTRRNELKQEINRSMFSFVNEQQRIYYYEYLREFLKEVNRISERLDEYFDKVDDSTGKIHNEAIKWDVSLVRDAIFDINFTVTPFLPTYQNHGTYNGSPEPFGRLIFTDEKTMLKDGQDTILLATEATGSESKEKPKEDSLKDQTRLSCDFSVYIKEENRENLVPYLVGHYKGKRPQEFGFMLYALHTLTLIEHPTTFSHEILFEALQQTFDIKWTRQALTDNINKLNKGDANKELKIKQHTQKIKQLLYQPK